MENRKNRKITPSGEENHVGTDNPTFNINEVDDALPLVTAFPQSNNRNHESANYNSAKKLQNSAAENPLKPLKDVSNVRANLEQWRSYVCSRRVRKRKTQFEDVFQNVLDEENMRQLSWGLGLDDQLDGSFNLSNSKKGVLKKEKSLAGNEALIQYFAKLGQSKADDERIDLDFVQTLLDSGANINCTDKHGQTIMHEVSRAWHVDVAKFIIGRGADVNKADNFGRTPLHVAAAVDYVEMINILIENNADKEAKTFAENQTPVFYAAKTDAIQALKSLIISHGCLFQYIVDYKGRTPIHVAAELDRSETARLLMECEAPVYLSDNQGSKAITWMISKMAPVANKALNQLYSTDRANRKQYFALNHLVRDKEKDPNRKAHTPFYTAIGFKQYDLLMHPVFRRLLDTMWHQFGRSWALFNLGMNLVYIIIWTVIGILVEYDKRHIYTFPGDTWRVVLYFFAGVFTLYQFIDEAREFKRSQSMHSYYEETRKAEIEKDIQFCHPRWPEERKYLDLEIEELERQKPKYFSDMWNIFDWICYVMLGICIFTHVADICAHTDILARVHMRFMTVTIILLWLRLMKNARAFSILGPFIVMLGHMLKDCLRFLFLYMEFYIPYLAAFWMTFGATKKVQNENEDVEEISVSGFQYPGQIFFSLFRLTLVDDYDYDNMTRIDSVMAQILLTTWFLLSSILSVNLFIALLSDTFQRVYDNAQANAVMQRAIMILNIWEGMNTKRKEKFLLHIENNCSPLREEYDDDLTVPEEDELKKVTMQIKDELDDLKEMFKLQFGDPKSLMFESDFNKSEGGDVDQNGNNSDVSKDLVHRLQAELNDLRESIKTLSARQESKTALLHKDMKSIKLMLKQVLDSKSADIATISDTMPARYSSSEQTPLPKMKKSKRRQMSVGLEIDTVDNGSTESPILDGQHRISELTPDRFQDTTYSAQSQVFNIKMPPPSSVSQLRQKPGSGDGDSTNC